MSNPFSNYLHIEVANYVRKEIEVRMTNSLGQSIFETIKTNDSIDIEKNTTKLLQGLYFVSISQDGIVKTTQKVILTK